MPLAYTACKMRRPSSTDPAVGSTVSVGWPISGAWAVPMEEVPAEAILGEVAENDGQLNSPRARPPSTSTVTPEM